MLRIITLPATLFPGTYLVSQLSSRQAAEAIRAAGREGRLESYVAFEDTAAVLEWMSGQSIEVVDRVCVPPPDPGDAYLHVRLASGIRRPRLHEVGMLDLDYFWIEYEQKTD